MLINDLVKSINNKLAGEMLSYNELRPHLNTVIDDINTQLDARYPTFTDVEDTGEYTAFPDNYLRTVVVPGAAWYYYVVDEEGSPAAQQFSMDYSRNLFMMLRDMVDRVPIEYQADVMQGAVTSVVDGQHITFNNYIGEW